MMRRRRLLRMLPIVGVLFFYAPGEAQVSPPGQPVALIVPGSAGDGLDLAGRAFAEALTATLGRPVRVENVPGAMTLGLARIHGARPDGSTLGMVGSFAITAPLSGAVPFGPKDLTYLAHLGRDTFVLAVPASSPYRTLRDYLAAGSGDTRGVSIGTAGPGTLSQVAAASIAQVAAVNLTIVHFPGSAGILTAVRDNRVASAVLLQSDVGPPGRGPGPRPLAVFGDVRMTRLPGVPTAAEENLSGVPAGPWLGVGAPPGIAEPVRKTLVAAIERAAKDPKWKAFAQRRGLTASFMTGPRLERFVYGDVEALRVTMQSLGLLAR